MKVSWREVDAMANEAMTRFFDRTGWTPVESRMPFHEMMELEDDGQEGEVGDYEIRQRMIGVKAFFRFLKARGIHPAAMLKQLAAAGRACHEEPFAALTMEEAGMLLAETKAAHSWRCKVISGELRLSGALGVKLPGQKSAAASESYRAIRTGRKKERRRRKQDKAFLRHLRVMETRPDGVQPPGES